MTIQHYGVSCFKITTKNGNEEISVVIDPYADALGKLPRNLSADLLLVSRRTHDHHNNVASVSGEPFLIEHPGEYEAKGIPVYGSPMFHEKKEGKDYHKNTVWNLIIEDIRLVHLGGASEPLTDDQLAQIGEVDVLMIPVGGGDVYDAKAAADLVARMEPRVVIPMHYAMDGAKIKAETAAAFVKESGLKTEETDKLKLVRKDLAADDTRLVLMKRA